MPRRPTTQQHLRLENTLLRERMRRQRADRALRTRLRNAPLNDLVSQLNLGIQTNLTSFNPIVQNNIYAPLTVDWLTLAYMFKTHGPIQTAIEVPVLDALRGGIDITSPSGELDATDIKDLQDEIEEKEIIYSWRKGEVWSRLFGGGALVLLTEGQDPKTPLVMHQGMGVRFYAATRWEMGAGYKADSPDGVARTPLEEYNARFSDEYEFYGKKVHKSRVLTLAGKDAPPPINWQLQGWGMSEVERMVEAFNVWIKTNNVLYEILEEAKLDVFRLHDFYSTLGTPGGTSQVANRMQTANQLKSFNRAIILDKNDEYEQKQLTFSGLAEVMKENRIGLASALRMPMTKLFGLSASGFNAGEDDIENYNAMVESEVRQKMRPMIRATLRLLSWHLFGFEADIDFSFKPLRVMSSMDEEVVKTSKQNRVLALYDRGLYTAQEAAEELKGSGLVTIDTAAEEGLTDDRPDRPLLGAPGGKDKDEEDDDAGRKE